MKFAFLAAAAAALATTALAQVLPQGPPQTPYSEHCPLPNLCYRLSIPPATARTGKGTINVQINALVSYTWVGLGMGHQMAGARMFIVYADGNGNVTLSPRLGSGHEEPRVDEGAVEEGSVRLAEGSGVDGFRMVANVICENCEKWIGGNMNFSADEGWWIWAALPGFPLHSDEVDARLEKHEEHGRFLWDYAGAKDVQMAGVNPLLMANATNITSHGNRTVVLWHPYDPLPVAHGTLASLVMVVLFPGAGILIRVTMGRRLVWVHAGIQIVSYLILFVAMSLGILVASRGGLFFANHPRIGLGLVGVLFFQAVDGLLHHAQWVKRRRRTWLAHLHIWTGRLVIVAGMINGGLGLQLAHFFQPLSPKIKGKYAAYIIAASISFLGMIAANVYGWRKERKVLKVEQKEEDDKMVATKQSTFE